MKRILILVLAVTSAMGSPALARDKTDVIQLTNGDRVTGEIKQLEHGILRLGTESMGEVQIEWDDIVRIKSDFGFQFERSDGQRITGTIVETPDQHEITLRSDDLSVAFAHDELVRISQIDNSFWKRLQGSMTFGYSFTKASDVAQGNFGYRATHRTEKRSFALDGSTIVTSDQDNESTQRTNLSFSMTRFRKNRWFNTYLSGLESNDELGLNLRTSIGLGLGRYLQQTNSSEFGLIAGVIGTSETLEGDVSSQENIEGLLALDYSRYIYDDPMLDLSSRLSIFPSITESGRMRAQFDINLRWEMFADLFWDLGYYNTYDSNPASGSESTNDYGVVTSIGWSF
jgi:hypothetical protein